MSAGLVTRTIELTDYQFALLFRAAARRGQSVEEYVIARALTARPRPDAGPHPLVLSPDEQHALRNSVSRIDEAALGGFETADPWVFALTSRITFLFEATMLQMLRAGEHRELSSLLADSLGKGRASRILREFRSRALSRNWLDPPDRRKNSGPAHATSARRQHPHRHQVTDQDRNKDRNTGKTGDSEV